MIEVWKTIKDYPDYKVSNLGRVKSFKTSTPKILKGRGERYLRVSLTAKLVSKNYLVHRLVAIAFLGEPKFKIFVNHINGKKFDNKVMNLEWVTHKENIRHSWRIKLSKPSYGNSKLSATSIKKIRVSKECSKFLAVRYNVSVVHINRIKRGAVWQHI